MISINAKAVVSSVVSSALAVSVPDIVTSQDNVVILQNAQTNARNTTPSAASEGSRTTTVRIRSHDIGWTAARHTRFKELARLEALRDLSDREYAELETLSGLRRTHNHPRSADEILWERRQRTLTRSLLAALERYVEFHEVADHS